jgi:hypothetical protein
MLQFWLIGVDQDLEKSIASQRAYPRLTVNTLTQHKDSTATTVLFFVGHFLQRSRSKIPRQDKGPSYGLHKGGQDDEDCCCVRVVVEGRSPKSPVAFHANHAH